MTNERQYVLTQVRQIIVRQLDCPPEAVVEGASLVDDLGADSLSIVEMVLAIEEVFGISVPDEDAEALRTVGDAVTYIEARAVRRDSAAE